MYIEKKNIYIYIKQICTMSLMQDVQSLRLHHYQHQIQSRVTGMRATGGQIKWQCQLMLLWQSRKLMLLPIHCQGE